MCLQAPSPHLLGALSLLDAFCTFQSKLPISSTATQATFLCPYPPWLKRSLFVCQRQTAWMLWVHPLPCWRTEDNPNLNSCTLSKATTGGARRTKYNREHLFKERRSIWTSGAYPHFQLSLFLELLDPEQEPGAFCQLESKLEATWYISEETTWKCCSSLQSMLYLNMMFIFVTPFHIYKKVASHSNESNQASL